MPDSISIALIAGGSSLLTAILTIGVNAWLGSRRATNDDARLGLDALKGGLAEASKSVERLTIRLNSLEARATLVLTENNRFRAMHGEDPALSLESFEALPDKWFEDLVRMGGRR